MILTLRMPLSGNAKYATLHYGCTYSWRSWTTYCWRQRYFGSSTWCFGKFEQNGDIYKYGYRKCDDKYDCETAGMVCDTKVKKTSGQKRAKNLRKIRYAVELVACDWNGTVIKKLPGNWQETSRDDAEALKISAGPLARLMAPLIR